MAVRIGRRVTRSRVAVLLVTLAFSGLALPPLAQGLGGTCNGQMATPGYDASFQHGPVVMNGTVAKEVFIGSSHSDSINGGGGDDTICAGSGDDSVSGGGGDDRVFGEKGNDSINGGDGKDNLYGGDDDDVLTGGFGEDRLFGDDDDDTLNGLDDGDPGPPAHPAPYEDELEGGDEEDTCTADNNDDMKDCEF